MPTTKPKKNFAIPTAIMKAMRRRQSEIGIDLSEQLRRSLEDELQRPPQETQKGLPLSVEHSDEAEIFQAYIDTELWDKVKKRKAQSKVDLKKIVLIALSRYLQTQAPAKKIIQQVVRDELAAMGVMTGAEWQAMQSRPPTEILDEARRIQIAGAVQAERANLIGLYQFSSVPCGPWKDVLEEARPYFLPKDMAEVLGAEEGDWLLPCRGQSMREAGIPDGGLVVMHPLDGTPPESGAIVLCCVEREGGQWLSTIKYFYRDARGRPELRDGKLQLYHLPPDAKELHPLAVLVGVMGKATKTHTVKGRRAVQKKIVQDEGDRQLAQ